jgi:hypothetical protein
MDTAPKWPAFVLKLAAIYNLVWGAWTILLPNQIFDLTGIERPNYPGIWQCVGMIVGVYGIGYWFAARDFRVHWPIVLVGFLGKIFGPIGFVGAVRSGELPLAWGVTILTNDLIWWIPFAAMLYLAFKHHSSPEARFASLHQEQHPKPIVSSGQETETFLSQGNKLLVFVRHAGCTFCGETLSELASLKEQLRAKGIEPVVVHMSPLADGKLLLDRAGLSDVDHVSDPACELYRRFGLSRGRFSQLFGPEVWVKGFQSAIIKGNKVGKLQGDGFQLGGAALLSSGSTVQVFPSKNATTSIPTPEQCKLA